jgi:GTP cyclohydrolase I
VDRTAAAAAIDAFLRALGHDPEREPELASTGKLVADAFVDELLAGERLDPVAILGDTLATQASDPIAVRGIETCLMCPHHLLPAPGVVHVCYAPSGRIVGLGALGRLVECYARRLTLQEAFGTHVVDALVNVLGARGAACAADFSPTCLTCRGERIAGARVRTLATAGEMREGRPLHATALALLQAS